jgi:predicted AAA+ superfamily ATPase
VVDVTLREAERHEIGYRPSVLDDVEPDGLYVLRGPRRVGKSVVVKRLIASLLKRGIEPLRIVYLPLSDFSTQDLRRALVLGRSLTTAAGDVPRFWLFDEITAVADWTKVLKDARDETPLRRDAVVLTGSSAHDLVAAQRDLGAGRAGDVADRFRLLLPMSFRDVVAGGRPEIPLPDASSPDALQTPVVAAAATRLDPWLGELDLAWQTYLEIGGFPRAVAEHMRAGRVSESFCLDLRSWLSADVTADDPPDAVLRLLSEVGRRMTSPLHVSGLADALGLGRTATTTRINRLRSSVAALSCPQIGADGTPVAGSQSKLYLLDPLLSLLPQILEPGLDVADMTRQSEAALAAALARRIERLHPGRLLEGRAIGYGRTSGGREVDFAPMPIRVGGMTTSTTPLESKWVSSAWRREALVVENKYGRGVLATKDILDTTHPVWALPAPLVALLLG